MRFEPLTEGSKLPDIGAGAEHALWDLKQRISTKEYHLAKDVAAFANYYGGTLLIGAEEDHEQVKQYHPMTLDERKATESAFHTAVKNLCSPKPDFNYVRFEKDGGWVLAVNVWPSIATIIGVKVLGDKKRCDYAGDAYVFPVRIVNHSDTIGPEAFPMHMLPELRRTVLLLSAMPKDASLTIYWAARNAHAGISANGTPGWKLLRFDERRNYAVFKRDPDESEQRAPLDAIYSIYCDSERDGMETWKLFVAT